MKSLRKDTLKTRQSLLIVAADIFADKGYRDATVAEICEQAGANIAAVNYHFQNKENLYREAWRYSFAESMAAHPPDGGVPGDAPAAVRLRGMIQAAIRRTADENNREYLIVHKELASPTGLLGEVMHREIRPLHDRMEAVVRELLGPRADAEQISFCVFGIISQCLNPVLANRLRIEKWERGDGPPGIDNLEAYADHVTKFSLAGISARRREIARSRKKSPPTPARGSAG